MARILAIGVATLDIINTVDGYPRENDKLRALARRQVRGGNAANTLVVLSRLGHRGAWAGTLADDEPARLIRDDLQRHGIDLRHARARQGASPVSYVTHNRRNGSRTIIHYRELEEFSAADFRLIELTPYDWCHFEGRNVAQLARMLAMARAARPALPLSLEVEKPRPGIEALFGHARVLLFSRDYAASQGAGDAASFLAEMSGRLPGRRLFCTWGEDGAWAVDESGHSLHAPAHRPPAVVDTLGAGDTFNAGVIHGCLAGYTVAETLRRACRLAGEKCGHEGLDFTPPP